DLDPVTDNTIDLSSLVTITAGGAATISLVGVNGGAANGTVGLANDVATYTPNSDFFGTDTFVYSATNTNGTDQATITVNVAAVNDPPTTQNDNETTAQDTPLTFAATNLTANDSPGPNESDTLTVTNIVADQANGGTIELSNGNVIYTPDDGFTGQETFTYTVSDGSLTATGVVTITVTDVNDPPVAENDTIDVTEDVTRTIAFNELLANDAPGPQNEIDAGQSVTINAVTQGTNGTVTLNATNITYQPNQDFFGTDTFTYTVQDDLGLEDTATVTVNVAAVNDPPVATDDQLTVDELSTDNNLDVLANDNAGPMEGGQTLTITDVTTPANGTATIAVGGGSVIYTPEGTFVGQDTFSYTISDGEGGTATATVSVNVVPVIRPRAIGDTATTSEDAAAISVDVLGNDLPNPGAMVTLEGVGANPNATITIDDNGSANDRTDDLIMVDP
ncbi:MAG: Ig-like domain-containing protein, partial [Planctomycetota bacterium]